MEYVMTSVYDTVSKTFNVPFHSINKDVAIRYFVHACRTVSEIPASDIELYYVGKYDDERGDFIPETHELLARGADFVEYPKAAEPKEGE